MFLDKYKQFLGRYRDIQDDRKFHAPAFEKIMEAGVLINGGPVPKTLTDHLQALIDVRGIDRG